MDQEDAIATLNNELSIQTPLIIKKKRNLPGNPDPDSEVIALSPKTLMTTNRFVCEVCGKGFPRDQNLQLHRRGHNLPWKLKQRNSKDVIRKRVYVCPEKTCVHHHPSRALGDLTGIKKHFCRKHGEKKWKCEKCCKKYAVQSDWKAHSKTCGTREYRCDCGTVFSRRDSFITHRAFCDALAEETARINAASHFNMANGNLNYNFMRGVPLLHGGGGLMQAPIQQQQQQHFSNFFKPFLITKEDHDETRVNAIIDHHHHQIQKGNNNNSNSNSLPLWIMGQDPSSSTLINHNTTADALINQQIGLSSINPFYTSPQSVVSCSDPQQEMASNSYQMNWFLGDMNKMCPTSGEEEQQLPLMNTTTTTTTSIPSIYSNQHQLASSTSAPHMSATALLQKAAQIGATTSDPVFLGEIKLNEAQHDHHLSKYGDGSGGELGGYGSNSTTTNLVGSDVESTENVFSPMSSNNHQVDILFPPANKRRRVMHQQDQYHHHYHHDQAEEGGQTRDFLGVGVESICHPSPITGWI